MGKPRNTQKYPKYPEIPESKKDTRKYPIVFFDTPTRPEPDPLPGILSNTRPDIEKPYPLGTKSMPDQKNNANEVSRWFSDLWIPKLLEENI